MSALAARRKAVETPTRKRARFSPSAPASPVSDSSEVPGAEAIDTRSRDTDIDVAQVPGFTPREGYNLHRLEDGVLISLGDEVSDVESYLTVGVGAFWGVYHHTTIGGQDVFYTPQQENIQSLCPNVTSASGDHRQWYG